MKVLVTGATGFVGRHVMRCLIEKDVSLVASSLTAAEAADCQWPRSVNYLDCDLARPRDDYFDFFGRPDVLIHLAWAGLPNYKELFHFEQNLFNDYRFIKSMIGAGLQRLVVTGTCLEYGLQEGMLQEDGITMPSTAYGIAKDSLRKFIEQLSAHSKFNFNWVRLFYLYGEGQPSHALLPQLDAAIRRGDTEFNMSAGQQQRDYLPVAEAAANIVRIALQDRILGTINNCSGVPISILDFVKARLAERRASIRLNLGHHCCPDYEPMRFWGSTRKLTQVLHSE
ncbi:MAG: NAD(P)-dependent oxidoreductase [Elusimicrobia bacterium]|nr:NAD(P)-dependent oxidoreductase [Elusimicrobiota bacterium]